MALIHRARREVSLNRAYLTHAPSFPQISWTIFLNDFGAPAIFKLKGFAC